MMKYFFGHPANISARTITGHDLPVWMPRDKYIQRGYRIPQSSVRACFESLWYLHNETVNIWSHLLALSFMLYLLLWSIFPSFHSGYRLLDMDLWALQLYLVSNILCLFFSVLYHCACCYSENVATCCLKLDYLGIVLGITSTAASAIYIVLYEYVHLSMLYISLNLILGGLTFCAVLGPSADGSKAAIWRTAVFITLGASGYVPIMHALFAPEIDTLGFPIANLFVNALLYISGGIIYASRIPEKQWPDMFDIWGSSHQLFHVIINITQMSHLCLFRTAMLQHSISNL